MISYLEFYNFSKHAEKIESDYITSKKSLIKQEVLKVTEYISRERAQTKQNIENRIKQRVYEAHAIATNIYNKFNGELPEQKIKKLIIEALRPQRFFNDAGYYFIHSLDGTLLLHATHPEKEGSNRLNLKSSTGQPIVKELFSIIKKLGEGFLNYKYPSIENSNKEKRKITFVKHFKPFNWSIGTGDYEENIEKDIKNKILNYIGNIKFGDNSYIFVVNFDGIILMNGAQKHLIGVDMSKLEDPNGVNVFEEERDAVKNKDGGFIYYVWNKPSSSSPSPKMTFMKGVQDWQWMIGTGLYIDDAKNSIIQQKHILKRELIGKILYIFILVILSSIFILYVSNKFTKRFTGEIGLFLSFFTKISEKAEKININSLRFLEFKDLAISANKMLDKKIEAEKFLHESERNLKAAQRITHFGSWELDIKNNVLHWSDEVYRIFNVNPQETSPSYELFLSLIHPDDKHVVDEAYHLSLKNKSPYDVEHRILLKDGTIKYVRGHAETYYDGNGDAISSAGTIQDITELKEKEEQLRRTQKMDALGKLTSGIAHDYNNMMGIVLGYSELLLSQVAGKQKAIDYIVQIRTAGERARALTDKLMTFSRYKLSETEVVDINKQLKEQQHLLEKTLTSRIHLSLNLEKELWLTKIDPGDFNDAIINMNINVLHAIETNGTISITTKNIKLDTDAAKILDLPAGNYISVSIKDNGKGMDAQTVSKIFDPFFSTKGEMGTGLGLSQVYGFIKRSNGSIKVTSDLGRGTEFVLYFPQFIADENSLDENEIEKTKQVIEEGKETILVVDDEEPLCKMACEILTNHGYNVIEAFSAKQALEILKTEAVDIVFSDIIMPEMTGYELAKEVSEKHPNIIIQLTSGFNDIKNINIEIEAIDILSKPYSSIDLLKRMNELTNKNT